VEEGHSHRAAAARFRVSVKFVNDMVILKRETGRLEPRVQGNGGGHDKLALMRSRTLSRLCHLHTVCSLIP
jgi:transposase